MPGEQVVCFNSIAMSCQVGIQLLNQMNIGVGIRNMDFTIYQYEWNFLNICHLSSCGGFRKIKTFGNSVGSFLFPVPNDIYPVKSPCKKIVYYDK